MNLNIKNKKPEESPSMLNFTSLQQDKAVKLTSRAVSSWPPLRRLALWQEWKLVVWFNKLGGVGPVTGSSCSGWEEITKKDAGLSHVLWLSLHPSHLDNKLRISEICLGLPRKMETHTAEQWLRSHEQSLPLSCIHLKERSIQRSIETPYSQDLRWENGDMTTLVLLSLGFITPK